MNILLLANHFNAGGISNYILNLSKGLVLKGNRVYVGSSGGEWVRRLQDADIKHIYLPLKTKSILSPKLLSAYFILKKIIREEKIDIVHTQTRVTSVLAYWLSRNNAAPFVYTAHGFFKPRLYRRLFPCLSKLVIAISDPVKEHLIRDFHLQEEKIRVVHNGIDINSHQSPGFTSHQKEIRKKFGLNEGPVVGIVARLSEVKGHKYLLTAIKQVKEKIPEIQLLSIGDGRLKRKLETFAQNLGLEKEVHFIPSIPDTAKALSVMDVFVMPSIEEGLGLAIMEAMLAGIPVAASSVGGIPSLIKDGSTGILVKPKDSKTLAAAIIDLLQDKEKAMKLSKNASELIRQEFSLEKMVCETQEVYSECLFNLKERGALD